MPYVRPPEDSPEIQYLKKTREALGGSIPKRRAVSKTLPSPDAKLTIDQIKKQFDVLGVVHHVQPGAVSITQSTEYGTVYTVEELKDITDVAHEAGLRVHMDGARIANAAVSLGCDIAKFTADIGIDILSFGGTKNGMVYGEAIIVFDPELSEAVEYLQKQSAQLPSKMRFIAAQFLAMLQNDRWLDYARHANNMAALLAEKVSVISCVTITQPTQANAVFATLPKEIITTSEDAININNYPKLYQSVDMISSIVSDPYLLGKIAANHAICDIIAVDSKLISALMILQLPFSNSEISSRDLEQVTSGAREVFKLANCSISGGHTMIGKDKDPVIGFSVIGEKKSVNNKIVNE